MGNEDGRNAIEIYLYHLFVRCMHPFVVNHDHIALIGV
jgi:hypothetical protein